MESLMFLDASDDEKTIHLVKCENGNLIISLDDPWMGDSESGFGANVNITLTMDQVISIKNFLIDVDEGE